MRRNRLSIIESIVNYRELIWRLALTDIRTRYKSPLLGFLWALITPLVISGIFWIAFTYIFPTQIEPYPFYVFLIIGMFPWSFFQNAISSSTMSILHGGNLIKKIYFPREVIPLSIVVANFINFLPAYAIVLTLTALSGVEKSIWILTLPLVLCLWIVFTTGCSLIVAGLQVKFRDVKYIVELGLLLLFYATPILYPFQSINLLPKYLKFIFMLNPLAYFSYLTRACILKDYTSLFVIEMPITQIICLSIAFSTISLIVGVSIFRHFEPIFAESID